MDKKRVSINIRKGKAYIPTLARTELGVYITVDPVYTVDLNIGNLTQIIEKVLKTGNPRIPHPTREELSHLPDPVLKAAKVSSWKKLAEGGATYSISQQDEGFDLEFYKKDEKGRFITDTSKTRRFPLGTELKEIITIILEDVNSHSEFDKRNKK